MELPWFKMDVTPQEFVDRLVTEEAHEEPCDEGNVSELSLELPPWYDEKLFKIGQQFFLHNLFGQIAALISGLVSFVSVPTTLDILIHTKKTSSPCTAYSRYLSTILHGIAWHEHALKPGTISWKSLHFVRSQHLRVAKNAKTCRVGTISQRDLAFTQYGLIAYTFLKPDFFGIQSCHKESWEGYNHAWRTICYMVGLKDKYNICIGTAEDTREICRLLVQRVFTPLLETPPEPFEHLCYVVIDGFWSAFPVIEPKSVMYIARYAADVPGYVFTEQELIEFRRKIRNGELKQDPNPVLPGFPKPRPRPSYNLQDFQKLSTVPEYRKLFFFDRFRLHTLTFLLQLNHTSIGRFCLNLFVKLMLLIAKYLPIFAILRFGFAKSYVDMFGKHKPDNTKPMSNAEVLEMYSQPPWYIKWNPFV